MVSANARLHADQAGRYVGKPPFDLTACTLLAQHDRAALIEADTWNEFLPMSMPIVATVASDLFDMAVLL
jgi:hypothetical protein